MNVKIDLRGAVRSQTYRPEHHNFGAHFLFAPHEEEEISSAILAELDAKGIRWIYAYTGDQIELYSACDVALACACPLLNPHFRRGHCNGDEKIDISDPKCILDWLFLGRGTPVCRAAVNVNGDGKVDISDPIWLLEWLFLGGPAPVAPFEACGAGTIPADDELGCAAVPSVCSEEG